MDQIQPQKNQASALNLTADTAVFQAFSKNNPYAMLTVDKQGVIIDYNDSAEQLLGFSQQQVLGQLMQDLIIPAQFRQKYLTAFFKHKQNEHDLVAVKKQFSMPTLDFSGNITELDITLFSTIRNKQVFYTALLYDNVARKQMLESLNDTLDVAQSAVNAKSDFLANMSHEIRSPMNIVLGMSRLLAKTKLTEKQNNYIAKVETASIALLGIINDILDFSKIEANKVNIEAQKFHLDEMLREHTSMVEFKSQEKGIDFEFTITENTPKKLIGDPLRLMQVFNNLVFNAIKFTASGGSIKVEISVVSTIEDEITLLFSVTDSGIGLTQEQQTRLFQPFNQADNSTTRKFGGTGLGLAISKQLTELMGGEIGVNSEFGQGSNFWFTAKFRLQLEQYDDTLVCESEQQSDTEQQLLLRSGARVLVVDDIEGNQVLVTELLEEYNFEVAIASNGSEAIEAIKKPDNHFDLVLMDLQMPVMGGVEATENIRQKLGETTLPIVAMTGNVMESDRQHCFDVGMVGHIAKPIDFDELYDCLIKWIEPKNLLKQLASSESVATDGLPDAAASSQSTTQQQGLSELFIDDKENLKLLDDFLNDDEIIVEQDLTQEQLALLQKQALELQTQDLDSEKYKPKLLILDKNPELRLLLQDTLQQDYELLFSNNAPGCMNIAITQKPDLVIIDEQVPEIDGFDICCQIKLDSRTENLLVILLISIESQMDEVDTLMKGLTAGAEDCLYKPLDPAILKLRVLKLLEIKLKIDDLQTQINTDPLTHLANQQGFELEFDINWKQSLRTQSPLSLIFVRVNQLKKLINQQEVDQSLCKISEVLSSLISRPGDTLCRYDRDLFVCLLPNTHEQGANWLAHCFWDTIDALNFTHTESGFMEYLSISVGGACTVPAKNIDHHRLIEESLESLKIAEQNKSKQIHMSYLEFFGLDIHRIDVDSTTLREDLSINDKTATNASSSEAATSTAKPTAKSGAAIASKTEPMIDSKITKQKFESEPAGVANKETIELIGIDKAAALKRVRGKERIFNSLLTGFVRDFSAAVEQISTALTDQQDLELAQRTAHSVKGMAGNLSAQQLFDAAYALEMGIKQGQQQQWPSLLNDFELNLSQVLASIQAYLQSLDAVKKPKPKTQDKQANINKQAVQPILQQLASQLDATELDAEETFETLKSLLGDELSDVDAKLTSQLQALGEQIDELDFMQAMDSLIKLSQQLEIPLI